MYSPKDEFVDIAHKLEEAHLAAQKSKDRLLVYLIERALFQAEKMAAVDPSTIELKRRTIEASSFFSGRDS
jgi:hypothetical protein